MKDAYDPLRYNNCHYLLSLKNSDFNENSCVHIMDHIWSNFKNFQNSLIFRPGSEF